MTIAVLAALFLSMAPTSEIAASRAPCAVRNDAAIDLSRRSIRIGDIVDLSCLAPDLRHSVAALELAQTPPRFQEVELSHAAIASLARRRAPILEDLEGDDERILLVRFANVEGGDESAPTAQDCFSLAAPLRDGAIVTGEVLSPASCTDTPGAVPLFFDRRSGAVRARGDLAQGAYLGRIDVPTHRYPDAGDALSLIVPIGPVVVRRVVVALEPAPRGGALFVRDEDGEIFSAQLPAGIGGNGQ